MQLTKGERSLHSRTIVTAALSLKQYENVCSRHVNAFQIENNAKTGKMAKCVDRYKTCTVAGMRKKLLSIFDQFRFSLVFQWLPKVGANR